LHPRDDRIVPTHTAVKHDLVTHPQKGSSKVLNRSTLMARNIQEQIPEAIFYEIAQPELQ
jgi:hypothetical protein